MFGDIVSEPPPPVCVNLFDDTVGAPRVSTNKLTHSKGDAGRTQNVTKQTDRHNKRGRTQYVAQ